MLDEFVNQIKEQSFKERALVNYDDDDVILSLKESILRPLFNDYEAKGEYRFFEAKDRYELKIGDVRTSDDKSLISLQAGLSLQILDAIGLSTNDLVFSIEENSNRNFDIKTGFIKSYEIKAKKVAAGKKVLSVVWAGESWEIV